MLAIVQKYLVHVIEEAKQLTQPKNQGQKTIKTKIKTEKAKKVEQQ